MKRILFFGSLFLLTASVAMTVRSSALFNWQNVTRDFGHIAQGKPVTAEFVFSNKGELPLVITNARGSCGCTGVDFSKSAILPGQSGVVKATFNAVAIGAFNKTVVVESNAEGGVQTLSFKGEVVSANAVAQ